MGFLDGAFAQHLVHYGYGAIFLIVMIESAGIPAPGETYPSDLHRRRTRP
jgi:membrane protein DedA with SNARE-associated domain